LLVRNVNADSPLVSRLVTLYNLKANTTIEKTLGGGEHWTCGQLPTAGWKQASDNLIYIDGAHADIEFVVLVLP